MTIIMRECTPNQPYKWRQILVITDRRVAIVEMTQALISGWNIGRVTIQGEADWPGNSEGDIVAFKMRNDADYARIMPRESFSPEFLAKLANAAGVSLE